MPKLIGKFYLEIIDDNVHDKVKLKECFKSIENLADGRYRITVEKLFRQRSANQNAFYWGQFLSELLELLNSEGWSFANKDDLHEWCKWTFNRKEIINKKTGEIDNYPGSTTGLETYNFETFMELIRQEMRDSYNYEMGYPD